MMTPILTTGLLLALSALEPRTPEAPMPPRVEIVVMRIDADGNAIYACVDSKEAAKRFLEAPLEQVARKAREK